MSRNRASKIAKYFSSPTMVWATIRSQQQILFKSALFSSLYPSQKVRSADLLYEKVKRCLLLYNKEMKGYIEKDVLINAQHARVKGLGFIENCKSNLILLFMLYRGQQETQFLRKIERLVLFSRKNNQEGGVSQVDEIRGVFTTQSNTYDEAFLGKIVKIVDSFHFQ